MKFSRRRFLTISACALATPAQAARHHWHGRAFGGDVSLTIDAPAAQGQAAIRQARKIIAEVEQLFSLFDPQSSLSQLNTTGELRSPDPLFLSLIALSDTAYHQTGGFFDPTVQPLWRATALGKDTSEAVRAIGWDRVSISPKRITLGEGQALTFNGIAQGFATDLVADALSAIGLQNVLVNIGEYRGIGGPWTLGVSDPEHGYLGNQTLTEGAIATSSPGAMMLGQSSHLLHPVRRPKWATVSVQAQTATRADSLSTAMCFTSLPEIEVMRRFDDIGRIVLVNFDGDLTTI